MKKRKVYCRLQELMQEKNINQSELAIELGIARTTVIRLFHNNCERIDLDVIEKLCLYFECEVGDLLRLDNG